MSDDPRHLFDGFRHRLLAVAYRMLGSMADAEDVVQDTFERWLRTDTTAVVNPEAYLTTMVTRRAMDRLGSAQKRREVYVGPWLPEPVMTADPNDPADLVELDQSVTLGYLHLLESLNPLQRAVHLLHEVFDYSYAEIAPIVGREESSCRQIASRARARLKASSGPEAGLVTIPAAERVRPEEEAERVDRFLAAVSVGDVKAVEAMLTADVVHVSDGGPEHRAARHPIVGVERVARLLANLGQRTVTDVGDDLVIEIHRVNNEPAILVMAGEQPLTLVALGIVADGIRTINAIVNPEKLRSIMATRASGPPF